MNKKTFSICLKWGVILGVCLAILELVKMAARNIQYGNTQVLDLAMIIGYVLVLYAAVKEFKEYYPGRLSFSKAFLATLIVSFCGSAILFAYDMVHYAFIEKDGLQKKHELALQNYRKVIDNDTVTAEELTLYLDTVKAMIARQETKVLSDSTLTDSISQNIEKGVLAINKFYVEKMGLKRATDTANNYRLGNFSGFARKTLLETLDLYSAQNEEDASTTYVQTIIASANQQLAHFDLGDIRFENNKSHVPQYDKPGRYAGVSALMDWLYGMFFGIFIALYHYRSKDTIEDVQPAYKGNSDDDEPEGEDEPNN